MFDDQLPQQLDSTVHPIRTDDRDAERGFALVLALLVVFVLSALITAYWAATMGEAKLAVSSTDSIHGQLAAEAGINLRCSAIRAEFEEWERPAGSPPGEPSVGELPCTQTTGTGSGAYECVTYPFAGRSAVTYVREEPGNPTSIIIPPGDRYASLSAEEWRYTVSSTAVNTDGFPEALLEMRWKTRNVPIWQMFALYSTDLQLKPGDDMAIHGPIHSNGDLYFFPGSNDQLDLYDSPITMVGGMFRGNPGNPSQCKSNSAVYIDANVAPSSPVAPPAGSNENLIRLPDYCPLQEITQSWLDSNGLGNAVETDADPISFPPVEKFDPPKPFSAGTSATAVGGLYWQKADLRVVLTLRDLNGDSDTIDHAVDNVSESTYGVDFNYDGDTSDTVNDMREMWIEVRNPDNSVNAAATRRLTDPRTCPGQWNSGSATDNKPVGPLGGTHPATIWYTYEKTLNDDNWKWKDSGGSSLRLGVNDWREVAHFGSNGEMKLLEVDMGRIWDCLHDADAAGEDILYQGRSLDDNTNGGLVFYFSVDGPDSDAARSNYGVRFYNANRMRSTTGGVPLPIGLTLVTDHAAYIMGDFNTDDWIPTAVISDTVTILSNAWLDDDYSFQSAKNNRQALSTTLNSAFLAGKNSTNLNTYPVLLENWGNDTLSLMTSFVRLFPPRHNAASNSTQYYRWPTRNWDFDQRFAQGQQPPMAPRFTYSQQEMFTRNFEW